MGPVFATMTSWKSFARDLNELLSFDEDDMEAITQAAIRQSNAAFGGGEDREKSLANIDTQLKRIVKMIERAYRDNAAGNLSDALLDEMMNRFGKERQALENQRDRLVTDTSEEKSIRDAYDLFFALAQRYSHIETLDRDILHALIERIEIGEKILPEGPDDCGAENTLSAEHPHFLSLHRRNRGKPCTRRNKGGKSLRGQK